MGASGLLAAHKAKRFLKNYELICYEKNPSVGGTWWENRYPGVACDIPAHTYTFPFDANPDWSEFYAGAPEIQEYFMRFYEKHNLEPFVKLNTEVVEAEWHDLEGLWHVTLKNRADGSTFVDKCNVIINGSGVLVCIPVNKKDLECPFERRIVIAIPTNCGLSLTPLPFLHRPNGSGQPLKASTASKVPSLTLQTGHKISNGRASE